MQEYLSKIEQAAQYIESRINIKPKTAVILGSGLGLLAEQVDNPVIIDYKDIPNYPVSTVVGHAGRMIIGYLEQEPVIIFQGRFHFYEGYKMEEVTLPIRTLKLIGVENLIVTNASGGINTYFNAGDLMIITDHINFAGINPLMGQNLDKFGHRFPDMTQAYSKKLINIAKESAQNIGTDVKEGVYLYVTGPSYETPAEIRMFRTLGADAVGMSTVPEVIVAKHSGLNVLGISCIANLAAGILETPLNHEEVLLAMDGAKDKFISLIKEITKNLDSR